LGDAVGDGDAVGSEGGRGVLIERLSEAVGRENDPVERAALMELLRIAWGRSEEEEEEEEVMETETVIEVGGLAETSVLREGTAETNMRLESTAEKEAA